MPELKRNFTKGRMNKDLDERMVPDGEYRNALNVEVSTSEGSNVGTIQTLKGNTNVVTGDVLSNLTASTSLFSDASCVGSIVNEKSNKLYWLVADAGCNYDASWDTGNAGYDTYSHAEQDASGTVSVTHKVYSDYILEYDDNTKECNWIAVENYKVETVVSNDSHSTGTTPGDHLHVSNLGLPGDIRPVGIQVGMDVLVNGINTRITKIEEDDTGSWNGWRVYTKHTAADFPGLGTVTAGTSVTFTLPKEKRALGFSHFANTRPGKLITGINIIDNLLFWTDNLTEPKKINIERCKYGSTYGAHEPLTTVQPSATAQTHSYGTRKYPTLLIVNGLIPSSTNYRLASIASYASAILYPFLSYQYTTVIKKSPLTPLRLTMSKASDAQSEVNDDGVLTVDTNFTLTETSPGSNMSDYFFTISGEKHPSGYAGLDPLTFLQVMDWVVGDIVEFYPTNDDAGFEDEALVTLEITSATNGLTFEFEVQSISSTVLQSFRNWNVKLQGKDPLFEFKFPRFAYRWKYEDGEYSCYSPFSEVAFLPDRFDYFPKKGFNLGMTNNLRYLLLSNFKPTTMPLDVVEIDVVYKESNSPNIYTVETIKSPSFRVESLNTVDFDGDDSWKGLIEGTSGTNVEAPNTLDEVMEVVGINTFAGDYVYQGGIYYIGVESLTNMRVGSVIKWPNLNGSIPTGLTANVVVTDIIQEAYTEIDPATGLTVSGIRDYISLNHNDPTNPTPVTLTSASNWYTVGTEIEAHDMQPRRPAVYLDHPQGSLEVKTDMIHATLPANQLLRPWDNVPRKSLSQEVSGNRIIYGNYVQNYDLKDVTGDVVKQKFNFAVNRRKNIRENIRYNAQTALLDPTTGATITWYDPLNTIPLATAEPERSIKSIRDYQVGVVFSDEFGRQTPVQTHDTGVLKIAKTRADDYNGLTVKLKEYNYPEWATHYKYYIKENANEYYNLAMDRFYDAEDGNIWLSFPSSERNKVDEETFLILKKQHDSDKFVKDKARYKILAIKNEAPDFVKTKYDTFGTVSTPFGAAGKPRFQSIHVDVSSNYFSSSGGTFEKALTATDRVMRISSPNSISRWYNVVSIASYGGDKRVTVDKNFGIDMAFTTDDGTNTGNMNPSLSIEIAKKVTKNLPEFDGRFFVKIHKDAVVEKHILAFSAGKEYITSTLMKMGYSANIYDDEDRWRDPPLSDYDGWWVSEDSPFGEDWRQFGGQLQGIQDSSIDVMQTWGAEGHKKDWDWGIYRHGNNFNADSASLDHATKMHNTGQLFRWKGDTTVYRVVSGVERPQENYNGSKWASNHSVAIRCRFEPKLGSADGMMDANGNWSGLDAIGQPVTQYDPRHRNAEGTEGEAVGDWSDPSNTWNKHSAGDGFINHIGEASNTRHIEFLEEFIPNSSYSSDNPAIWETEPKENVDVDIYNEASQSYPIADEWNPYLSKFTSHTYFNSWNPLSYYNCFSFANGVESNRVRDDFNAVTIDKGPKVSTVLAEQYREERRKSGLIYSGIYNSTSGVNRLNQFIMAEKITKDLNPTYGSIQKLWSKDTSLVAFCEDRVIGITANKDALYNADGNPQLIASNKVLGDAKPFAGDFGISTDPESFAVDQYRAYFTDKSRGAVIRFSQQGLTPISDMGMKDYFKDAFQANLLDLIGSYDDDKRLYNLTIAAGQSADDGAASNSGIPLQNGQVSLWNGFATNGNPLGNWTTAGLSDDTWDAWHQTAGTFVANTNSIAASNTSTSNALAGMTTPTWSLFDNAAISSTAGTAGWGGIQYSLGTGIASNYDQYPLGEGKYGANTGSTQGNPVTLWFSTWTTGYNNAGQPSYDTTQNWSDLITQLNINGPGNVYLYMNDPFFVWEPYRLHPTTGGLFYPWVGNPALYYTGAWHGDPTGAGSPAKVHQPEACFAIQTIDYNATRKSYEVTGVWLCGETIQGDTNHFQWSLDGPFADDDRDDDNGNNNNNDTSSGDYTGIIDITVSYSEDSKGWTSFKSWLQESGASLNDKYFTFNGAGLYQHHSNETRNKFYGVEYNSLVCVIFNDMPGSVKSFASLSYEGSQSRIVANTSDGEYYNNASQDGWFAKSITSDLETGFIPEFKNKEGKWFNYIRGNQANNLSNLDASQFSTQGIGRPSAIVTTQDPRVDSYTLTIQDTGDTD